MTRPRAILFDRDGTLIVDVPYNRDPARVRLMPTAVEALALLRAVRIPMAVVSNQSGIGLGLMTRREAEAVNSRMLELTGPLGPIFMCPHRPEAGCNCRKPKPGLLLKAAQALGVLPQHCTVIGDIRADIDAARAVGARGILVPTLTTLAEEVRSAPEVASTLLSAVEQALGAALPS